MKVENYFNKTGKVYGVSYKCAFGRWQSYCVEFDNLADAKAWLNTEEGDFRDRELLSKSAVISDWGKSVYDNRRKQKSREISEDLWRKYITNVEWDDTNKYVVREISKLINGKWRGEKAREYIYINRNTPWDMCQKDFLDYLNNEGDYAEKNSNETRACLSC